MFALKSNNYKYWKTIIDSKECESCSDNHGKIYSIKEVPNPSPPLHLFCRCIIEKLNALYAGTATNNGYDGADMWLKEYGILPEYYLTLSQAEALGYKFKKGNLGDVAPGYMLMKGVYGNYNGHLPDEIGRIWYEADINYVYGYRGDERILFSNDGLIFVTYDHYETFTEII